MSHDPMYVETLPSGEQLRREFVATKGYGTHIDIVQLLRSGMTLAQVERFMEDQVREHYLMQKSKYIELWDKAS